MKLTRKQSREIAEKITNEELLWMFESARKNISDWTRVSDINNRMTKGKSWNILAKDFDINKTYPNIIKNSMLIEFGEYIPAHLKPYKKFKKPEKKEKTIKHEEPIFEDNSDNDESYYSECMKSLNRLLYMIHGPVCEICDGIFENESWLMPIHIISIGAMKRLQFILKNIVYGCSQCHKDYDEGNIESNKKVLKKMQKIKNDPDLINSLKRLYEETPLLKDQNVKEDLKRQFQEYEKNSNL